MTLEEIVKYFREMKQCYGTSVCGAGPELPLLIDDLVDAAERSIELQESVNIYMRNSATDHERYVKLEAENKLLRKGLEWQPIETAPKDGALIFLYWKDKHFPDEVTDVAVVQAHWHKDHWVSVALDWIGKDLPTHWMPLPPPPRDVLEKLK